MRLYFAPMAVTRTATPLCARVSPSLRFWALRAGTLGPKTRCDGIRVALMGTIVRRARTPLTDLQVPS